MEAFQVTIRFNTIRHGHPWRLDENWESPWLRKPQMVQVFDKRFRCKNPPGGQPFASKILRPGWGFGHLFHRGHGRDFGTVESQVHWWRARELLLYHLKYSIACYFQLGAESQDTKHRRRERICGAPFANISIRGMMPECQWLYGYPFLHTLDMGYLLLHQEIKWTLNNMCQTHQTFLWIKHYALLQSK
jgi:hypothetical protein